MTHRPIDGAEVPADAVRQDPNYVTRSIEIDIERAVAKWIDNVAKARGLSRRAAASIVAASIERLARTATPAPMPKVEASEPHPEPPRPEIAPPEYVAVVGGKEG